VKREIVAQVYRRAGGIGKDVRPAGVMPEARKYSASGTASAAPRVREMRAGCGVRRGSGASMDLKA